MKKLTNLSKISLLYTKKVYRIRVNQSEFLKTFTKKLEIYIEKFRQVFPWS